MLLFAGNEPEVFGTPQNDTLIAGPDSSFLYGGAGRDFLIGRGYFTDMTGGAGRDLFAPDTSFDAFAVIEDFHHGIDKIVLPKGSEVRYLERGEMLLVNGHVAADVEVNGHAAHVTASDFLFI